MLNNAEHNKKSEDEMGPNKVLEAKTNIFHQAATAITQITGPTCPTVDDRPAHSWAKLKWRVGCHVLVWFAGDPTSMARDNIFYEIVFEYSLETSYQHAVCGHYYNKDYD